MRKATTFLKVDTKRQESIAFLSLFFLKGEIYECI